VFVCLVVCYAESATSHCRTIALQTLHIQTWYVAGVYTVVAAKMYRSSSRMAWYECGVAAGVIPSQISSSYAYFQLYLTILTRQRRQPLTHLLFTYTKVERISLLTLLSQLWQYATCMLHWYTTKTRKAIRPKGREFDPRGREWCLQPPVVLTFDLLTPKLIVSCPCPRITCINLDRNWLLVSRKSNFVLFCSPLFGVFTDAWRSLP